MFAPRTNHKSLTLLTSTVLALGLCVSPSTTTVYAAEKPGDSLHWTTCPADITTNTPPMSMQCTTFKVPLDYGKPDDKKITIMMSRIKATEHSRGVILINPGGPGQSALNLWTWLIHNGSSTPLHRNFDLIAVQPRGLEHATPLLLQDSATTSKTMSHAGIKEQKDYKELFAHITTENTARDFDMARQYLGQQKINFYGASYGTWLGAVYATLFPQHTDRLVLDSAVDPTGIWLDNLSGHGDLQRRRMYEMFDFLAAHDDLYHLGDTPLKVYTRWYRIIEQELHGPAAPRISAPPAQIGDVPPEFKHNIQLYLTGHNLARPIVDRIERAIYAWEIPTAEYSHNLWEITGTALTSRSYWPQVAVYMQNPNPQPLTDDEKVENLISSNVFKAIVCNENTTKPAPLNFLIGSAAYFAGADAFTLQDLVMSSGITCLGITPSTKPVKVVGTFLKNRPVVLQSIYDTQTPYAGDRKMAQEMNAYFIKTEGGDHIIYAYDNPEARKLVNNYYLKEPIVTRTSLPYTAVNLQ